MQARGPLLDDPHLLDEIRSRLALLGRAELAGHGDERPPLDPEAFAREAVFIICSAGVKPAPASQLFARVMTAILSGGPVVEALGHPKKASAIEQIWAQRSSLFGQYHDSSDKLTFLRSLPWIGSATSYDLAKRLGLQLAKPDTYLQRLADRHATNPQDLCEALAARAGLTVNAIDDLLCRACSVGALDAQTARLQANSISAEKPSVPSYQHGLFEPEQISLFS